MNLTNSNRDVIIKFLCDDFDRTLAIESFKGNIDALRKKLKASLNKLSDAVLNNCFSPFQVERVKLEDIMQTSAYRLSSGRFVRASIYMDICDSKWRIELKVRQAFLYLPEIQYFLINWDVFAPSVDDFTEVILNFGGTISESKLIFKETLQKALSKLKEGKGTIIGDGEEQIADLNKMADLE